jgi:hypothetical protein
MFKENICISLFTFGPSEICILNITYFLENYIGMDDWHCRYIRSCCTYVCRIRQGRKTHALWEVSRLTRNVKRYSREVEKPKTLQPNSTVLYLRGTKILQYLGTVSKLMAAEGLQVPHIRHAPRYEIHSPGRPDARNTCVPGCRGTITKLFN